MRDITILLPSCEHSGWMRRIQCFVRQKQIALNAFSLLGFLSANAKALEASYKRCSGSPEQEIAEEQCPVRPQPSFMAMAIVANALALYPSSQHRKCSLHAAEPIVREQPPPSWFLPETSDWPPGAVVRPNHLWRHVVEQVPCHYASPHTLDGIYWNLSPSTKIIFWECQSWFLPEVFNWPVTTRSSRPSRSPLKRCNGFLVTA